MQGAERSEWLFHSQALQRRRRALLKQPSGTGAVWAPSFVASRLKWPAIRRVLLRGWHPKPPPSQTQNECEHALVLVISLYHLDLVS